MTMDGIACCVPALCHFPDIPLLPTLFVLHFKYREKEKLSQNVTAKSRDRYVTKRDQTKKRFTK
ncbi:MAG: hypothetical protein Q4E24_09080 [bacterium]|nr:hypothetical protein [bacterium]